MRIMAFSDLHASKRAEAALLRLTAERRPELVAIAGDLTNFGPVDYARRVLEALPVTALVVPGNMDDPTVVAVFPPGKVQNLHLRKQRLGGQAFVGLGGWIVSPSLAEPWGVAPKAAEAELVRLMEPGAVLLTHVPPFGHLDAVPVPSSFGGGRDAVEHIGSPMVRNIVEHFRPVLVISGHVHECRGVEESGGTLFVNPGPAKKGFGAVIELEGRHATAELLALPP